MDLNTDDDLSSVHNYSLWLDIQILLKTQFAVIRGGRRLNQRTDLQSQSFSATDGHLRWGDAVFNLRSGGSETEGFHKKSLIIGYNLCRI